MKKVLLVMAMVLISMSVVWGNPLREAHNTMNRYWEIDVNCLYNEKQVEALRKYKIESFHNEPHFYWGMCDTYYMGLYSFYGGRAYNFFQGSHMLWQDYASNENVYSTPSTVGSWGSGGGEPPLRDKDYRDAIRNCEVDYLKEKGLWAEKEIE